MTVSHAGFADFKLFLQPSFDASDYVRQLIRDSSDVPSIKDEPGISTSTLEPAPLSASTSQEQPQEEQKAQVDLSLAISRLNLAIDELSKSISDKVTANASQLLQRTSRIGAMRNGLSDTRNGINTLQQEVDTLHTKVHHPFVRLQTAQTELLRYDEASDVVARAAKFVAIARRLETQMAVIFSVNRTKPDETSAGDAEDDAVIGMVRGRDLARAALTIREISTLLERENALFDAAALRSSTTGSDKVEDQLDASCSILDLDLVKQTLPAVESAQKTVTDYMEDMIVRGLRDLSPIMLSSSLQTAFNLGTLASLVKDLLFDLTEVVKERIAAAFDLDSLSRMLGVRLPTLTPAAPAYTTSYKSWSARGHSSDTNQDSHQQQQEQTQWAAAFWKRLETLIVVEMGAVCSKVYTLEKVLRLKTDSETAVNFLDSALEVLEDRPSVTFWNTFGTTFRSHLDNALAKSPFLAQLLTSTPSSSPQTTSAPVMTAGYPKLLRMFQSFFAKVSVYTDIVYDESRQSPETVELLYKTLHGLQQTHLDKSTLKLAQLLSHLQQPNMPPHIFENEAENVVRLTTNLLDSHRFDPLLVKATLLPITALLEDFVSRLPRQTLVESQSVFTKLVAELNSIGVTITLPTNT